MRRLVSTLSAVTLVLLSTAACAQDAPAPAKDGAGAAAPGGAPAPAAAPKKDEGKFEKTASGLEYQILVPGKGKVSPKEGDKVKVNYKGWREDGFVFDESARHGGTVEFPVGGLIPGWNEALTMMTAGAKWKLRIKPELGYGADGAGPDIPPNTTLLFELELLDVTPGPKVPDFVQPVAENQKATPTGLKYEVLAAGEGDAPTVDDVVELKYAFFNTAGKLLECTERSGQSIVARPLDMKLPFLKEAPLLMKAGAKFRFEVPGALGFGPRARGPDLPANSATIWTLEMVRVQKVPKFEKPDAAKFQKTASGLQWRAIKDGAGDSPKMGERVKVQYSGWLMDGTQFDSSFGRPEPAEFQVGGVIPGWNEALQMMKPGAVWVLVIPPELGYGDRGAGDKIKPGATLVFQVELVAVVK